MATVSPPSSLPDPPDGFADEIRALVEATAPRLFAVVPGSVGCLVWPGSATGPFTPEG